MTRRTWSTETDDLIRDNWRLMPIAALAKKTGIAAGSISRRARELGLAAAKDDVWHRKRRLDSPVPIAPSSFRNPAKITAFQKGRKFIRAEGERETIEQALARGVPVTRCPPMHAAPHTAERLPGRLL